ncbi:hypothetical protein [Aquamicrobium sp.]|uniref:CAF17-like 4Fe-4S cluster assembly/insertion protein YgfZ n=1 Tax=Aquamicrobium sp. TaxID=1872579 RepID=UPI002586B0E5|nr:hypothetical protein [Aquamicrobium sp.]MCK9552199.1 hypothetical protein [Aquamicrobium sp.]
MSHSTHPAHSLPTPALSLPANLLHLSGRDAITFAQAQFANDVALLADGQWQWNLWLSAKGRVVALFALLRLDGENLLAWLPDFPAEELAQRLTAFRFRSKLTLQALPDASALGLFGTPADAGFSAERAQAHIERDDQGQWRRIALDLGGDSARTLVLHAADTGAQADQRGNDASLEARWNLDDIAHGLPRLGPDQREAFTPQMLGLDRLAAFSVKKGCYPGQEIVARVHFLGQAKRGALRLALNQPAIPGTRLRSEAGAQAEVISIQALGERTEALAIAPLDAAEGSFHSEDGDIHATTLPLLDGLAR